MPPGRSDWNGRACDEQTPPGPGVPRTRRGASWGCLRLTEAHGVSGQAAGRGEGHQLSYLLCVASITSADVGSSATIYQDTRPVPRFELSFTKVNNI